MKKEMRENRGLTLVELIITIAILAIVVASATSFMVTGSKSFTKGSADSELQREAELTVNQIEDMVIDTDGGLIVNDDANKTELILYHTEQVKDETDGTVTDKYVKESVSWDKSGDEMRYNKWDVTYDADTQSFIDGTQTAANQLLAERVSAFEVELDQEEETAADGTAREIVRSVQARVGYENGFGRVEYATSPIITLRNRMLLSGDPAEIFKESSAPANMELWYEGAEVDCTVIIDRSSPVQRGRSYNIYAMLTNGSRSNVNHLVDWEIEESTSTSVIDSSGFLSVNPYETNEFLTIVARYKENANKKAIGVLKVEGVVDKSFDAVSIVPSSLEAFAPKYTSYLTLTGRWREDEIANMEYTWSVVPEDWADLTPNGKNASLAVHQSPETYGNVLTIRLSVTSPAHLDPFSNIMMPAQTRTAEITYPIPTEGTGGDSRAKRGMADTLETLDQHGDVWNWFQLPENMMLVGWEYYMCDINGNKLSEIDSLYHDYIILRGKGDPVSPDTPWDPSKSRPKFEYTIAFKDRLPANQNFYIKVIAYLKGENGTTRTMERIHTISRVQMFDSHAGKLNLWQGGGMLDAYFSMVGFYNVGMQTGDWENLLEIETTDFDYEIIEEPGHEKKIPKVYVTYSAPVARADHGDNEMLLQGTIHVEGQEYWQKLKVHYLRIKVSMKEYPDVYTYIDIYQE